jgi:nitrate/nitrite-specific signal transduction histidine kinase
VADQVKQSASQVTEQAKQTATSQLATRKDQVAQGLSTVSSSVRQMGDNLQQNEQTSSYAQYVNQAADQIDRFSGYLQNHEPRQLVSDAESWARRNPALFLGGAFALGLLASRFLKSGMGGQSQPSRSWQSGQSGQYRYNDR